MTNDPKSAELTAAVFHYLVTLSHGLDDMPMRLFLDRDEAFSYATTLPWMPSEEYLRRLELPDCSTPCVISICTFRDGEPISHVIVRNYDDEGGDDDEETEPVPSGDCHERA